MIIKPKIIGSTTPTTGDITVRFLYLDIEDGKLVNKVVERYCDVGGSVTAPTIPTTLNAVSKQSCALSMWNWNITNLTNLQHDLDVGALYDTADGKTHAFVLVNTATGLSPTLYFAKTDNSTLTISWGDGSANYTTTSSGNLNTSHTYATAGIYEITMWISSGSGNYSLGDENLNRFMGNYYNSLKYLYFGENITKCPTNCCSEEHILEIVSCSHNINNHGYYAFNQCYSLKHFISSYLTTFQGDFSVCYSLTHISLVGNFTSVREILSLSYSLQNFVMPESVTTLTSTNTFRYCVNLQKIYLPSGITSYPTGTFDHCYALKNIDYSNIINASDSALNFCVNIKNITLNSTVTNISANFIYYCTSLRSLTVTRYTAPSTITTLSSGGISGLNPSMRIYVPVGSLAVYQAATNWSTYANRMYEDTPENRALFGD